MFRHGLLFSLTIFLTLDAGSAYAQATTEGRSEASSGVHNAVSLAENGHCREALPLLRKSIAQTQSKDRDVRLKSAVNGVRCAMTLHQVDAALEFLRVLTREFPKDPDALYVSVHAYSDLSTMTSQKLAADAPGSYQARELLAEAFESQGRWDDAEKEYRGVLERDPNLPGIHFRLGRLLLSKPNPSPGAANRAKQEFSEELKIDPRNAGAEYVLGEMARQAQQWDEAVSHFSRAVKLDPQFGEAFLGLGMSLNAEKQYADAVAPLETAVKLEPRNPDAHYNLAMAFARSGHKEESEKEFAIHQNLIGERSGNAGQGTPSNQPQ
jgi:tetratricopeptide (TPR) repeat protein